jgi:murein DD-endopeptidase MepM/ murein hydrolase activator NlpD
MALTAQDIAMNETPSQGSDSKTETSEVSKIKMIFPFAEKDWGITSGFGWRWLNGKQNFHTGVDIAAYLGTEVLAAHSGSVFKIDEDSISGRYIVIESEDHNYRTYYLHLNGAPVDVWTVGTPVAQGKVIGYVGQTASPQGAHLHFELQYKEQNETEFKIVNPMTFVSDYKPKP